MNKKNTITTALIFLIFSHAAQAMDSRFLLQHTNSLNLTDTKAAHGDKSRRAILKISQDHDVDPTCFITDSSVCVFTSAWGAFSLDLSNEYSQQQILAEISAIYAQFGNYKEARRIADALTIESYKTAINSYLESISIFSSVTPTSRDIPQISDEEHRILLVALEEIGAIEEQRNREEMLVKIAVEFSEFGLFDTADSIQSAIQDPILQSFTLLNMAKLQLKYGLRDKSKANLLDAFNTVLSAKCNAEPCLGEYNGGRILDSPQRLKF